MNLARLQDTVNTHKKVAFLYTTSEQFEEERENNSIYNSINNQIYRLNLLIKEPEDQYTEHYKILLKLK